jgi:hypothetical protein
VCQEDDAKVFIRSPFNSYQLKAAYNFKEVAEKICLEQGTENVFRVKPRHLVNLLLCRRDEKFGPQLKKDIYEYETVVETKPPPKNSYLTKNSYLNKPKTIGEITHMQIDDTKLANAMNRLKVNVFKEEPTLNEPPKDSPVPAKINLK